MLDSHLRPMWKTYFHKAQKQIVTELHSLSANSIKTYYGWMAKPQNYRVGAEAQEWITSVRKKGTFDDVDRDQKEVFLFLYIIRV